MTKEQKIDEIVDELVKTGRLLHLSNKTQDDTVRIDLAEAHYAKIKTCREELKQLLKE